MKAVVAGAVLISVLGTALSHAEQPYSGTNAVSVAQTSEQVPLDRSAHSGPYLNLAQGAPQSLINANQAELQPPGWHDHHGGPFEGLLNWLNGTGSDHDHAPQHHGAAQSNTERKD